MYSMLHLKEKVIPSVLHVSFNADCHVNSLLMWLSEEEGRHD